MGTRGLILASLIVWLASPAYARPSDDPAVQEIKRHYDSGLAHFNLQEYPQAIEEFEAASRLPPDPVFLYNLAQAHRLAEHHERALYFYRTFLRSSADPRNRRDRPTRCRRLSKSRPRIRPRRVSGADANQLRSLRVQHSDVHVLLPMRHVQHDDPGLPGNDRRPERVFVRNVHRELQRRRRNRDLHERHVQLMLLVSPVRFELTTNGLKGRCSTG